MFDVILFGTGKGSLIVKSALKNDVNIICYCDNDKSKWNRVYNGKEVIDPNKILSIKFDFVVIASQFNEPIYRQLIRCGIIDDKILQFYIYIDYAKNNINIKLKQIPRYLSQYEFIATGLSYTDYALSAWNSNNKLINLANASQDLFYDYNLMKFIIYKYRKNMKCLKYALVGLSYYSFEYDMSLSEMKGKIPFYYEAIGISRNFENINKFFKSIEINKKIAEKIFDLDEYGYPKINWYNDVENKIIINEEIGKKQALLDCKKNYPITVKENIEILGKYLDMLKNNDIIPIITCL
jgi:hypothetical protein